MTPRRLHTLFFLILAVQLVLGVSWTAAVPLWQGHEPDFFTVVRYLTEHGRLPTPADYPPGTADTAQVTQPPLWFLVAAPVVAALDSGAALNAGLNPIPLCIGGEAGTTLLRGWIPTAEQSFPPQGAYAAAYGLRLLNLALGVAAVVFTFAAARVLFPARPALALAGAALLAFEPSTLRMMTFISNDTLLLTIAAANLYCAARLMRSRPLQWGWAAALLGLSVLAVLTRLTGWAVLGLNVLLLLALAGRVVVGAFGRRASKRQAVIALGMIGALAVGVLLIAAFNLSASGSVFGRYSFLDERVGRALSAFNFSPLVLPTVIDRTRLALLEPFQELNPHRYLVYAYVLAVVGLLMAALAALIAAVITRLRGKAAPALGALLLLWAAFVTAAGLVYFRNVIDAAAYGGVTEYNSAGVFAPIRYYAPGLPAFALLLAVGAFGLMDWASRLVKPAARLAWLPGALLTLGWAGVALLTTVQMARAVPSVPAMTLEQARALPGVVWLDENESSAGFPRVIGYEAAPGEAPGLTALTLYAVLDEPGVSALGRVLTGSGACEFVPGRGSLPLTVWEQGTVYLLEIDVPYCGDAVGDRLDLAVQWQAADASGLLTGEPSPPVTLGSVPVPAERAAACPAPLGRIAGYTIVKYTAPEVVAVGELFQPSLNWIVEDVPPEAAGRVYTFTHGESGQSFTCARTDGPLSLWTRGTYRYFDRCPFTFPPDAPLGPYTVSVALLDINSTPLPARGPAGEALADGHVAVGQVILQ